MKDEFFGFYEATSQETDNAWESASVVFDANALLNLYRYSDSTRNDFLSVIDKLKDKLHMPYQVGFEYHSNRRTVIESLKSSYFTLNSSIDEIFSKSFDNILNQFSRHPSIEVEILKKVADDFRKKLKAELEKQQKKHPDFYKKDVILEKLTEIYKNKVGKIISSEDLEKIYKEGKERYDKSIPPGYKDLETKKKKGERNVYGDLIIWKEMINYSKQNTKQVIFVTDDRKEDWWKIESGKTVGPREELIKEFYDLTGVRILIYNADSFLHFAKERKLVEALKDASISEVKEVRRSDETFLKYFDFLHHNHHNINSFDYKPSAIYSDQFLKNNILSAINPGASTIASYLNNAEANNNILSAINPSASIIASYLNNAEANNNILSAINPGASTIASYINNAEANNNILSAINPSASIIASYLNNAEVNNNILSAINPSASSITSYLNNAEANNNILSAINPSASTITSYLNNAEANNNIISAINPSASTITSYLNNAEANSSVESVISSESNIITPHLSKNNVEEKKQPPKSKARPKKKS